MKRWLKPTSVLLFFCVLTQLALASPVSVNAQLWYNDIQLTLNDTALSLKDANGNAVEPFIIDGTTYLPVRAVAQTVGLDVKWDGDTNTVVLTRPVKPVAPSPVSGFYREKPAPIGVAQAFTYTSKNEAYSGVVTVERAIRGDEAWDMIEKASRANKKLDDTEYILAKVSLTLLESKDDAPVAICCRTFSLYDSLGDPYGKNLYITTPVPCFGAMLSPGETTTGYIAFEVQKVDEAPRILIKSAKDSNNGFWFALTEG